MFVSLCCWLTATHLSAPRGGAALPAHVPTPAAVATPARRSLWDPWPCEAVAQHLDELWARDNFSLFMPQVD
jgi:hypothetical protein